MSPLFAIMLPIIILFAGLSLDSTQMELKKAQMQNAADSAAVAAELELERDGNTATNPYLAANTYITSAQEDASLNGFTNGSGGVSVTVSNPPTYGEYSGRYDAVEVIITAPVPTFFITAIKHTNTTLTAYAVAQMPACNFAMNTNNHQYATMLTNSSIYSTCPLYTKGGATVDGASILASQATLITGSSGASSILGIAKPTPNYNVVSVTDPLAGTPAPVFYNCAYTNWLPSNPTGTSGIGQPKYTLTPGTYCGGINAANIELDFQPGLYIITGASTWVTVYATCSGCTFYFTKGGGSQFGQLSLTANSSILLSAPNDNTNGGIPGILFFFDRVWTPVTTPSLNCNDAYFPGNGIIYSINAPLSFLNCENSPASYFGVVTDQLLFNGVVPTGTYGLIFYSNYSSLPGGNPFRTQAVLVQ